MASSNVFPKNNARAALNIWENAQTIQTAVQAAAELMVNAGLNRNVLKTLVLKRTGHAQIIQTAVLVCFANTEYANRTAQNMLSNAAQIQTAVQAAAKIWVGITKNADLSKNARPVFKKEEHVSMTRNAALA